MSVLSLYNCFYVSYIILLMLVIMMLPFTIMLLYSGKTYIIYWLMFQVNNSMIEVPMIFDGIGLMTSMVVLFISSNVMRFSMTYMVYDTFILRFNILVLMFVLSMNMLIYIPSLIILLLGWDGLGFTSFLLVIYYQNSKSLGAGMITALTNRIGDALLLLAIVWSLNSNNWLILNMWNSSYMFYIGFSVLIASLTKSAQMPFSSWLPAAMAAPTPVSALVHSSTLVTAGVFLLIRFYNYLSEVKDFEIILLVLACLTMFMAAFCAIMECDLKKIIALSTLSQLGVMMTSLSIGLPKLALFHLMTHALFKALLFVCAGSFIFLYSHNQDLRLVGNLMGQLPMTSVCFMIGSISLCGLPFLSGFYSKDLILEMMFSGIESFVIIVIIMLSTGGTALYSMRLAMIGVMGMSSSVSYHNLTNEDKSIIIPIMNLTIGAILGGAIIFWLFAPFDVECFMPEFMKLSPFYLSVLGGIFGGYFSNKKSLGFSWLVGMPLMHNAFSSMWFLSPMSSQMTLYFFKPAYYYLSVVDHGWIESLSAQGVFSNMSTVSKFMQPIQGKMINMMLSLSMLFILVIMII